MAKGRGKPFGGFPGGGNMNQLLQQAQKMQKDMQVAQEELAAAIVDGSAAGGLVSVQISGDKNLLDIVIKPEAVDPDDIEMLQDLIIAAFNDAQNKLEALSHDKLGRFGQMGMGF